MHFRIAGFVLCVGVIIAMNQAPSPSSHTYTSGNVSVQRYASTSELVKGLAPFIVEQ